LEWPLADARTFGSTSLKKRSESGPLVLVPPRGILEIGLVERPNDEPAGLSI
jgi:hypothetical protein